jgi:anti-sigma factor RsiW
MNDRRLPNEPLDHGGDLTEDVLSAYLDDELDTTERAEVERRLATSSEWRAILDEVRATREALRALPQVDGSPEFWARVLAGDKVVDLARERRRRSVPRWAVAAAGAAAAAVIVVGVVAVPQEQKVRPAVASFADEHAARSSVDNDVISSLASVGVPTGLGK